jgi:hypothetical protein
MLIFEMFSHLDPSTKEKILMNFVVESLWIQIFVEDWSGDVGHALMQSETALKRLFKWRCGKLSLSLAPLNAQYSPFLWALHFAGVEKKYRDK